MRTVYTSGTLVPSFLSLMLLTSCVPITDTCETAARAILAGDKTTTVNG